MMNKINISDRFSRFSSNIRLICIENFSNTNLILLEDNLEIKVNIYEESVYLTTLLYEPRGKSLEMSRAHFEKVLKRSKS